MCDRRLQQTTVSLGIGGRLLQLRRGPHQFAQLRRSPRAPGKGAGNVAPGADHVHYALALAQALSGDFADAQENLQRAIELEPRNRTDRPPGRGFRAAGQSAAVRRAALSGEEELVGRATARRTARHGRHIATPRGRHRRRQRSVGSAARPEALRPARPSPATPAHGHHRHRHGDRRRRQFGPSAPRIRRPAARRHPQLHGGAERGFRAALAPVPVPLLSRPRAQGPQLRQPVPDGPHANHGRFSGRGAGLLGSAQDRRPHLSLHHRQRGAGSHAGRRRHGGRRNAHQPQPATHPARPPDPRKAAPLPAALAAIAEADVITLGPGSLFTSVVPNLLVEGIAAAIQRSSAALKRLLRQSDVAARRDHWISGVATTSAPSTATPAENSWTTPWSTSAPSPAAVKKRYASAAAMPVENDIDAILKMGVKVVAGNLSSTATRSATNRRDRRRGHETRPGRQTPPARASHNRS